MQALTAADSDFPLLRGKWAKVNLFSNKARRITVSPYHRNI